MSIPPYLGSMRIKTISRVVLATFFIGAGITHFTNPAGFLRIVPPYLPAPLLLVYLSGAAEIAGGLGLLIPATRRWAAWGLMALLVAVFPANVYMLQTHGAGLPVPLWALWLRLPLQLVLIGCVWWSARPNPKI
ncbi:DoxX family protein [Hymenobacter perfusus]|nr:MauE/DoxX family redox-associated membrane protein [Hymenobacter perfusus]